MLDGCVPWAPSDAARYRAAGYWRGESLGDLLRAARRFGQATAVVDGRRRVSFVELDDRADRLTAGLHHLGLEPGQRVVLQLPNVVELITTSLALFRAGVIPVYALPAHRRADIAYLCQQSGASALIVADSFARFDYRPMAAEVAAETGLDHVIVSGQARAGQEIPLETLERPPVELPSPDPSEVAFFLLSGGTTGMPKLIPRTHDDYGYQLRATAEALGMGPGGAYLASLPAAHNAALGCPGVLGTILAGGKAVLAPSPAPDEVFPLIERERVTLTTLMPPLVKLWIESAPLFDVDLSGVLLQIGSAALPLEVARQIRPVLGCEMTHWFGMAEGLLSFTRSDQPDGVVFRTTGTPLCPDDEILVVGDDGAPVAPGETGELLTRGPYTIRGYYRAEEHNTRSFTPDGFFRTGDLVRLTETGDMAVEGRIKDVINRGGEKVSAAELEDHLLAHPAVRDVAVVGVPDETLGERTCACVIVFDGAPTLADLRRFLAERGVAAYKLPERLELMDVLPTTRIGKIDKVALRQRASAS